MHRLIILAAIVMLLPSRALAGSIFITGHDPIWHAGLGGNVVGAQNLATAGIEFARNGSSLPFLFIESNDPLPGGNAYTEPFLMTALGYTAAQFVAMDAAALLALPDFRVALSSYSAIVVASDHGGMLSADELQFLNAHSADIIDYLNVGGGLYAEAESNAAGMIGSTPRFGFLPFVVSSSDFQSPESGNTVTAFGASLGLGNSDVNGNFSHNFFSSTGGMIPVDLFNGNQSIPLSLAFRGQIDEEGTIEAVPEPASMILLLTGLSAGAARRYRARRR
ncbi:MAG: PEP-CTERM sorting domain-containing protein [Vicinamibacterales bacterium]